MAGEIIFEAFLARLIILVCSVTLHCMKHANFERRTYPTMYSPPASVQLTNVGARRRWEKSATLYNRGRNFSLAPEPGRNSKPRALHNISVTRTKLDTRRTMLVPDRVSIFSHPGPKTVQFAVLRCCTASKLAAASFNTMAGSSGVPSIAYENRGFARQTSTVMNVAAGS
eukprot:scaffold200048_cov21-Prasinocladus_malaysianus.AAC.1